MNRVDLLDKREAARDYTKFWRTTAAILAALFVVVALSLGGVLASTRSDLADAQAANAGLEQQAAQYKSAMETANERATGAIGQVSSLESENAQLTTQVDNLQGQVRGLEADVRHWKGKATAQAHANGYSVNAVSSFGDGTWRVGEEIQPGTYRAPGGGLCYWERLSGFSGNLGDIITNDFGTKNGTVTIASSDVGFHTEDCGTWKKIG